MGREKRAFARNIRQGDMVSCDGKKKRRRVERAHPDRNDPDSVVVWWDKKNRDFTVLRRNEVVDIKRT